MAAFWTSDQPRNAVCPSANRRGPEGMICARMSDPSSPSSPALRWLGMRPHLYDLAMKLHEADTGNPYDALGWVRAHITLSCPFQSTLWELERRLTA